MLFHTSFACCSSSAASALLGIQLWSPCDRALWGKKKKRPAREASPDPHPARPQPRSLLDSRRPVAGLRGRTCSPADAAKAPRVLSSRWPPGGALLPPRALGLCASRGMSPARPPGLAASGLASRLISLLPPPVHARRAAPRPQTARDSECRMTGCHGAGRLREPRPGSPGTPACQGTGRLPLPCADSPTRTRPET